MSTIASTGRMVMYVMRQAYAFQLAKMPTMRLLHLREPFSHVLLILLLIAAVILSAAHSNLKIHKKKRVLNLQHTGSIHNNNTKKTIVYVLSN